jgi:GNAT superfamily N-acetyltransferase
MTPVLDDFSLAALAAANEANMCAAYRWFGSWPGGEVIDDRPMLAAISGVRHPLLNGAFRVRLTPETADRAIDATLARFRARGVPAYWWVGPEATPPDLEARLEARGLPYDGDVPGMAVDLRTLPDDLPAPAALAIVPATSRDDLAHLVGVLQAGFHFDESLSAAVAEGFAHAPNVPGGTLRHYVARLEGAPVGATTLLLAAGVAGIYNVATLPEARGKGIATALVAAALREGREAGYRAGVLQSSEMGYRVYERLGFQQCCTFRHLVLEE